MMTPTIRAVLFSLAFMALAGCGIQHRQAAQEFARTQPPEAWGAKPPEGHRSDETAFIKSQLKDPESARFNEVALQRVVISASKTDPAVVPVWESGILVNARNSFGGYSGFRLWSFYYRNGTLFAVETEDAGRRYLAPTPAESR